MESVLGFEELVFPIFAGVVNWRTFNFNFQSPQIIDISRAVAILVQLGLHNEGKMSLTAPTCLHCGLTMTMQYGGVQEPCRAVWEVLVNPKPSRVSETGRASCSQVPSRAEQRLGFGVRAWTCVDM